MLSKGKKIRYSCPNCGSHNIWPITMLGQSSGECHDCNTWWPWRTRLKQSIKKASYAMRKKQFLGRCYDSK